MWGGEEGLEGGCEVGADEVGEEVDAGRVEHAEFVTWDGVGEEFALDDMFPAHGGVWLDSEGLAFCTDDSDVAVIGQGMVGTEGAAVAVFQVDLAGRAGGFAVVSDFAQKGEGSGFDFCDEENVDALASVGEVAEERCFSPFCDGCGFGLEPADDPGGYLGERGGVGGELGVAEGAGLNRDDDRDRFAFLLEESGHFDGECSAEAETSEVIGSMGLECADGIDIVACHVDEVGEGFCFAVESPGLECEEGLIWAEGFGEWGEADDIAHVAVDEEEWRAGAGSLEGDER
ncbi:MAG: hypothetical protein RI897_1488 [Verrucomicrobiota bacterium]